MKVKANMQAILADDVLAQRVARDCSDPQHDDRWCSTCQARMDGIADYREAVAKAMKETT